MKRFLAIFLSLSLVMLTAFGQSAGFVSMETHCGQSSGACCEQSSHHKTSSHHQAAAAASDCLVCCASFCSVFVSSSDEVVIPASQSLRWTYQQEHGHVRSDRPLLPPPRCV